VAAPTLARLLRHPAASRRLLARLMGCTGGHRSTVPLRQPGASITRRAPFEFGTPPTGMTAPWLDPVAHAKGRAVRPGRPASSEAGCSPSPAPTRRRSRTRAATSRRASGPPASGSSIRATGACAPSTAAPPMSASAGGLLVATGWSWDSETHEEEGGRAHRLRPRPRQAVPAVRWTSGVGRAGLRRRAYVRSVRPDGQAPLRVVDLGTGRTVGTRRSAFRGCCSHPRPAGGTVNGALPQLSYRD
jgi:hypothetical protein